MTRGKKSNLPQPDCCCEGAQGPRGLQGLQGPIGPESGGVGPQGIKGVQGEQGETGPQGLQGPTGVQGPQGFQGPLGDEGSQGSTGFQGRPGVRGIQGRPGGIIDYQEFYTLNPDLRIPPVPVAAVSAGDPVEFDTNVFSASIGGKITRAGTANFVIKPGVYRISWQATTDAGGQLQLWAGPSVSAQIPVDSTTVSTRVGSSQYQISNTILFTAQVESFISIRNPVGNGAFIFTASAGGTSRVSTNLVIECIASL